MTDKISILAIDDNMANLIALKAVINDALPDAEVYTALDGVSGMEIALREDIDVILLDIIMPVMNGYEVCTRLKKDEQLRHIPVVFLTAQRTDRESRIKALDSGAEGFLTKPLDEAELVAQIRAMAKIKEANTLKQMEKERLAALVAERTRELELELRKRKEAEEVRQKLEEELNKAQKLESLGVLAGGIAHDFNNLLSCIFGYITLAKDSCTAESKTADYLEKAFKIFSRAKNLTQQLLTFAKDSVPIRKTGSLAPLLKEITQFALNGSNVAASFHIAKDLWLCDFDESQFEQVVDNLVINAVQAMPLGGKLSVTAENIEISQWEKPFLQQGKYVHVSFVDTGVGIPPSLIARIFDPFFTTKQKGNGLGLAIVHSIINKHNGDISVESELDKGTAFHLFLPVSEKITTTHPVKKAYAHRGSGRILIMDDEDCIREIAGDMLAAMGYEIEYALNGDEALQMIQNATQSKNPFLAAIMDLTIKGSKGGKETINQLRKFNKDLFVFVSSGYSEDPVMANPTEYGFSDKIKKPFGKTELAELFLRHFEAKGKQG